MKRRYLHGLFAMSALVLSATQPVVAAEAQLPPSITVKGTGRAFSRPDMAEVTVGVVSQAATAVAALDANSKGMSSLIDVLKGSGIEEKDILTSNFSVSPVYSDQSGNSIIARQPKITGYRVENSVQAKVRKIGSLGAVLDAVVRGGANNIRGVTFSTAQPEPIADKARATAILDAKRKAEIYAGTAGVKLGRVLYISENIDRTSPMPAFGRAKVSDAPIAIGEQETAATVEVIYAIDPQ